MPLATEQVTIQVIFTGLLPGTPPRQIKEVEELLLRIETDWTQPNLPSFVTAFTRFAQQSQTAA